jgi:hypothetical protein
MAVNSVAPLHAPDLPAWRIEPLYSPDLAAVLTDAYAYFEHHPNSLPAAYKVYAIASPYLGRRVCSQQRMNLHYILARSTRAIGEATVACAMLDRALEESLLLHERPATAELWYLSGAIKRAYLQTDAASWDLRASRQIIEDLKGSHAPTDPRLEMNIALATALVAYLQARYDDARHALAEAHQLHAITQGPELERHLIAWTGGAILRHMGRPAPALEIFVGVSAHVGAMPEPGTYARIDNALAEAALDLAENAIIDGEGRRAEPWLEQAHDHARNATERCDAAFDENGVMAARLQLVRHDQLIGRYSDRLQTIGAAMKFAADAGDIQMLAMAQIALAHEFHANDDVEATRNLLRQIIARSATSAAPFMAEPAKWLLRRIGGW